MTLSGPFIRRPVATTLLTIGIVLAGLFAYAKLPVAPLPAVDFPTIMVQAQMAGASPETMASSVAAPLERRLGQIADVSEITSTNSTGSTRIVLQFGLSRNIDGAARDVQAAINAARADLPTALRSNPTWRKYNPADSPIMVLALTSDTMSQGQLYDAASTVLQQRLSQIDGVGNVDVGGSSLPAVRVEINPGALFKYGINLESVRAALASANANSPKGALEIGERHYQLYANDQAREAAAYQDLVVAYRNGAAVRLRDVAEIVDSVEDVRNQGLANGKPSVLLILYKQPNANVTQTVDKVKAALPQVEAALAGDIKVVVAVDRSVAIRSSLADTEKTLAIAVLLVVMVVFVFLRDGWATSIPGIVVPVSIVGTFAAMYLLHYSLDILSLMALTVATGFVVDDAIVVVENIARHVEAGMPRIQAALQGASEVGFTVLSMSASLIAVFVPILLMGGIVGRLFQEFALTLSLAIVVSLALSLTATPMMCARFLRPAARRPGRLSRVLEAGFERMQSWYAATLDQALRRKRLVMVVLVATVLLNGVLYVIVPKGFFPDQDDGLLIGGIRADQSISFQLMREKLMQAQAIVQADPAVANVVGFTGGRGTNSANVFVALKPLAERDPAPVVMARLRPKLAQVAGANLVLFSAQAVRVGGRSSLASLQYTLQADDTAALYRWAPQLVAALQQAPEMTDVNSDQQQGGLETQVVIDRTTAMRLGLTPQDIDNALYDAFGQRQVSTIYAANNQYHVIMELAPRYLQSPESLMLVRVSASDGSAGGTLSTNTVANVVAATTSAASPVAAAVSAAQNAVRNQATNSIGKVGKGTASSAAAVSTTGQTMLPLPAFARLVPGSTPTQVNHQGMFVATTLSFNLAPGYALADAAAAIRRAESEIGMPASIHGSFAGTAATVRASTNSQPYLILAALVTIYLVLGILYESYVHPLTILSTLPSAGVGAVLALLLFNTEFSVIALIGVFLLIGIVKKNAIMMIDFALQAQRAGHVTPQAAIREACLLRFRPIMMTTCAAFLGAVPLIFATGEGAELRRPLGIAIAGGLVMSQLLTLYTTPVVYIYLDRLGAWARARWAARQWLRRPGSGGSVPT